MSFQSYVPPVLDCRRCGLPTRQPHAICTECAEVENIDAHDPDEDLSLIDAADPSDWPYTGRGGDAITLRDITIGKHEVVCQSCWLVHPPGECP